VVRNGGGAAEGERVDIRRGAVEETSRWICDEPPLNIASGAGAEDMQAPQIKRGAGERNGGIFRKSNAARRIRMCLSSKATTKGNGGKSCSAATARRLKE